MSLFDDICLLVLDVDGVLTDGSIWIDANGEEYKQFHVGDGQGIRRWLDQGYDCVWITGRRAKAVDRRAKELGVRDVHAGVDNKLAVYRQVLRRRKLAEQHVAVMGDDLADVPLFGHAAFAATVPEAPEVVRSAAHFVTQRAGGRGAVREVVEYILSAQEGAAL